MGNKYADVDFIKVYGREPELGVRGCENDVMAFDIVKIMEMFGVIINSIGRSIDFMAHRVGKSTKHYYGRKPCYTNRYCSI